MYSEEAEDSPAKEVHLVAAVAVHRQLCLEIIFKQLLYISVQYDFDRFLNFYVHTVCVSLPNAWRPMAAFTVRCCTRDEMWPCCYRISNFWRFVPVYILVLISSNCTMHLVIRASQCHETDVEVAPVHISGFIIDGASSFYGHRQQSSTLCAPCKPLSDYHVLHFS
jgi:hypothetical protein